MDIAKAMKFIRDEGFDIFNYVRNSYPERYFSFDIGFPREDENFYRDTIKYIFRNIFPSEKIPRITLKRDSGFVTIILTLRDEKHHKKLLDDGYFDPEFIDFIFYIIDKNSNEKMVYDASDDWATFVIIPKEINDALLGLDRSKKMGWREEAKQSIGLSEPSLISADVYGFSWEESWEEALTESPSLSWYMYYTKPSHIQFRFNLGNLEEIKIQNDEGTDIQVLDLYVGEKFITFKTPDTKKYFGFSTKASLIKAEVFGEHLRLSVHNISGGDPDLYWYGKKIINV